MIKRWHYIWCLVLIGAAGFLFYSVKSPTIFPSASIDLSIPRTAIERMAGDWSHKLGYNEPKSIRSTVFNFDDDAKTFLEYELGAKRANELMRDKLPIWYWVSRTCAPLKQEEFNSWLSPEGKLVAFEHVIPNDQPSPSLGDDDARAKAIAFIKNEGGLDLSGFKIIEEGSVKQAKRIDHRLLWEDTKEEFHGARRRIHVYVSGNQVTAYSHFLYVPEEWTRKFNKIRSYNETLAAVANIFYVALTAAGFFIFLRALTSGQLRWKFSLTVALISALAAAIEGLNGYPAALFAYETSLPISAFHLQFAIGILSSAVSTFFEILVLVGAGEVVYRAMRPDDLALEKSFTRAGLRSSKTLEKVAVGLGTFGLHMGWISLYYLAGREFGFWSPMEVDTVEALSSYVPFFSAMQIGWSAGLTEELLYRVLGLAGFQKLVRNFWVANLLQAAAWAFMHSNYPQEPPYARGIELTVVGFIYGFVLKRYGFLACFFSHNLIDTFMGIEPLLTSQVASLRTTAWVALAPFVIYIGSSLHLINKSKLLDRETEERLLNKEVVPPVETIAAEVAKVVPSGYIAAPLKKTTRAILAIVVIAFAGMEVFFTSPLVAQHTQLMMDRNQAIKSAKEYMLQHGVKPEGFTVAASLNRALARPEMQYITEKARAQLADQYSTSPERPLWWQVRFMKPLVAEEFMVVFDQAGKPMSFTVVEPETASGEKPDKAEAQKRVEAFIAKEHPEDVPFELHDVNTDKKNARVDYGFRYNVPKYKVGDANYNVLVDCIGGRVSGFDTVWMIPDKWTFAQSITTTRQYVAMAIAYVVALICLIGILGWARGVVRSGAILWRPAILVGIAMSALSFARNLNDQLPTMFYRYTTDMPLDSFYIAQVVAALVDLISSFAMGTLSAAFGLACMRLLLADTSVLAILTSTFLPRTKDELRSHRNLWIDAVLIGYAAAFVDLAITLVSTAVRAQISPIVQIAPLDDITHYANLFDGAIGALLEAVQRGVFFVFLAAIAIGLYAKFLRTFKRFMVFSIIVAIVIVGAYKFWQEASMDALMFVLSMTVSWLFVARFAKENLLAYFFAGSTTTLAAALRVQYLHGGTTALNDSGAIVAFLLAPPIYAILRGTGLNGSAKSDPPSPQSTRIPTEETSSEHDS